MTLHGVWLPVRAVALLICCMALVIAGCGHSAAPPDAAPFEAAVERYLQQHNMALRIKSVSRGPTVTGDRATMAVSLTHAELGGPSVVWEFDFTRQPNGDWDALKRAD